MSKPYTESHPETIMTLAWKTEQSCAVNKENVNNKNACPRKACSTY
jgi:hypothetical protein